MVAIYHWVIDGDAPFDALASILEYRWQAELMGYKTASSRPHVFEHLAAAANWLNSGADWTPLEYAYASDHNRGMGWRAPAYCELPWRRPDREPRRLANLRYSLLTGYTLDVSEPARAAGLDCPVSVTTNLWERLIADRLAFAFDDEEARLAHLLGKVAKAYKGRGEDVYTWFYSDGEPEQLTAIKALFVPGDEFSTRLTVMMSGEEEV